MEESKSDLRRLLLRRRKSHPPAECHGWSRSIQSQALQLPQYLAADAVGLYSPIENEVDTAVISADALEKKKRVVYAKIREDNQPVFVKISSAKELFPGRFGILEPAAGVPVPLAMLRDSIIFVPGVAFDRRGHRIGRGGGWYDRLLGQLAGAFFVGLAFEFQLVDRLAADNWDQHVHCIITEKRVIDCGVSAP